MEQFQKEFIEFLVKAGALQFGEFKLKSGRKSPYFVNTGMFDTGGLSSRLGGFYAARIAGDDELVEAVDVLFGPAYKGIPLAQATAIKLYDEHGIDMRFAFDRKERKGHGDKGAIVGHIEDGDGVLILDDVFTTGDTKVDAVNLVGDTARVNHSGVLIAVDRREVGADGTSAILAFQDKYNIPVKSIVTIGDIVDYLHNREVGGRVVVDDAMRDKIGAYLLTYGVGE